MTNSEPSIVISSQFTRYPSRRSKAGFESTVEKLGAAFVFAYGGRNASLDNLPPLPINRPLRQSGFHKLFALRAPVSTLPSYRPPHPFMPSSFGPAKQSASVSCCIEQKSLDEKAGGSDKWLLTISNGLGGAVTTTTTDLIGCFASVTALLTFITKDMRRLRVASACHCEQRSVYHLRNGCVAPSRALPPRSAPAGQCGSALWDIGGACGLFFWRKQLNG
jgi:hypothetical protein